MEVLKRQELGTIQEQKVGHCGWIWRRMFGVSSGQKENLPLEPVDLVGHFKKLEFYSKCDGKLEDSVER